ncbi:hypothetical protein BDF14DRAFT_538903 [Spinellus fusiger]|nr:hypothetical protein BDF14DRAFT_538903 [Spinellus fusiger]
MHLYTLPCKESNGSEWMIVWTSILLLFYSQKKYQLSPHKTIACMLSFFSLFYKYIYISFSMYRY